MKYWSKHKVIVAFLVSIFIVGLIFGIILGIKQDIIFKNDVVYSFKNIKETLLNKRINLIIIHTVICIILIVNSFLAPLYIFNILYLFSKGMCIGFSIYLLTLTFGIQGLVSGFLYSFVLQLVYIVCLLFILLKCFDLSKAVLGMLFDDQDMRKKQIKRICSAIGIMTMVILLNDIIIYFFSKEILTKLLFLLN